MGPIEPQPTPFSALASASLSEAPTTQLSISPRAPEAMSATFPPSVSPAAATAAVDLKSGIQASRSLSESMLPGESPPSWAGTAKRTASVARPLDQSGLMSATGAPSVSNPAAGSAELLAARSRLALERNAMVLRGLQQSMAADGSGRKVSSSASIALTQRGNSTQSSMDLYVPDAAAAAAASASGADAAAARLPSADKSPSRPPPFPQPPRGGQPGRAAQGEASPQQQEPYEDAVRHWLHFGQQIAASTKLPGPQGLLPHSLGLQAVNYLAGEVGAAAASGEAGVQEMPLPVQLAGKEDRQVLAGSLPEGLRTALGLSMGQPVGQPQRKGTHIDAPALAAAGEGPGAAVAPPSLLSQAEAAAAAAVQPPQTVQAQLAASAAAAAAQQSLYLPMARSTAQIGMAGADQAGAAAAAVAGAEQLQAANPLSYQFYQMLLGSMASAAPKQQLQQQQAAFLENVAAANAAAVSGVAGMDLSALMRVTTPADGAGGTAAMAQLLSFRAEAFAVHLCVKLFHCTPADLPEDAREQLLGWLKGAPACTELYIRSGCVHLTVTVCACFTRPYRRWAPSCIAFIACLAADGVFAFIHSWRV